MNFKPTDPLFTEDEWRLLCKHLDLPARQAEVLWRLLIGMSDSQIAHNLGIAKPTVRSHMGRLFERFDVQDRTELVIEIVREFKRSRFWDKQL